MPATDSYARVPVSQIIVHRADRQRKEFSVEDLKPSIAKHGVLQPIIVRQEDFLLVAGERRLQASIELGLSDIPVRWFENLSVIDARLIELEENVKRKDLDWKDLALAVGELHDLHALQDENWTMSQTAEAVGLKVPWVSVNLRVYSELKGITLVEDDLGGAPTIVNLTPGTAAGADPQIQRKIMTAQSVREAYNAIGRKEQRLAGDALEELITLVDEGPGSSSDLAAVSHGLSRPVQPPAPESILNQSFLDWVPSYSGMKFNLIHCDFPYGINLFHGKQGGGQTAAVEYKDTEDLYFSLLEAFCLNLDKFMSVSGHLLFWYSENHGPRTREMFKRLAPSLEFQTHPLIWFKSDNAGIVSDVRRRPRHTYETCLLASRGDRFLVEPKADCYPAPTDRALHPSAKPEPMLRHFMGMLVDTTTTIFDPTCGAGSALRAAESLGAKTSLGLEIEPQVAETARLALRNARALRAAARAKGASQQPPMPPSLAPMAEAGNSATG